MAKDHSVNGSYLANQPYNQSSVYQPHPTILEPAGFQIDNGFVRLSYRSFQLNSTIYGNPAFLRAVSSARLPSPYVSNKYGWKYESRHRAQAILPFLYLGPAPAARDPTYIQENEISMVIAVRSAQSARAQPKGLDPSRFSSCTNLQTTTFDIDSPFDLITRIRPILKLMTDHLESRTPDGVVNNLGSVGGRILIFCESGNDRSPVLIAAYLMLIYGFAWHESLNLIHSSRFSVSLNGSMNDMLKTWEGVVKAESDAAAAFNAQQHPGLSGSEPRKGKRRHEESYDSDDTMIDENEVAVRPGIAPFIDVQ